MKPQQTQQPQAQPHNPRRLTIQTWTEIRSFDSPVEAVETLLLELYTDRELNDLKLTGIHRIQKRRGGISGVGAVGTNAVNNARGL